MSETKSLFGRAAKFVQDKAKEGKDAYDKRQLVQSLTELHGLRHHFENIVNEFDFNLLDRDQLPEPAALADMDIEALRAIGGGSLQQILGMARTQEATLVNVIGHIGWIHSRLYMLRDFSRNLSVSLEASGVTRGHLRPAIHQAEAQARARSGAIGGGNAAGVLMSIEKETLTVPVARIPEELRRYLTAVTYLGMFRTDRKAVREELSKHMLSVAVQHGALDHVTNPIQYQVLSQSLPPLLRAVASSVSSGIVRMREYASSDEYFAPHVAAILAGGEPDFSEAPDVPGLNRFLPEERLGKMNATLVAALRGELPKPVEAEIEDADTLDSPKWTDEAARTMLDEVRKWVFEADEVNLNAPVSASVEILCKVTDVPADMLRHALSKAGLDSQMPINAEFGAVEAYRLTRGPIDVAVEDLQKTHAVRAITSLSQPEKVALYAATVLSELGSFSPAMALAARSLLAWGDGKGSLMTAEGGSHAGIHPGSAEHIHAYMRARIPDYEGALRELTEHARTLVTSHPLASVREIVGEMLVADTSAAQGASLRGVLDYLPEDRSHSDAAVFLGLKDGQPVTFLGDESLLTVGAPGTGKTQGQVIPTLMTGNHSMVVLDIKGELLKTTQRDLEARGVRVLQFSLIDGNPGAHGYNPMTYLPNEPKGMWRKAAQMSEMLLPDELAGNGPWLANARTLLTCHACVVKLERGEAATLKDVMRSIKGGIKFVDGEEVRGTPEDRFNSMLDVAEGRGFHDLADEVASLSQLVAGEEGAAAKMWQSILLGVRPLMDMLMSDEVREATERSDWSPLDLRARDTRLFIQVRAVDLDAYKPLLRLIIGQHLQSLMEFAGDRPDMPVTFLLDELPQLGNFPEVLRAIEVGRSARVRVWGFVQDLAQIHATYAKAGVLINSPAVTSFLSFDTAAAEHLVKLWGMKHDVVRDQRIPSVEVADFFKPDMDGKMVCVGRGAQPVVMDVAKAHVLFADRLG